MARSASILDRIRRLIPGLGKKTPLVTIVRLAGIISSDARPGRGISAAQVDRPLKKAFRKGAAAVVVEINSPGGAPAQSRMIHDRIRALAAKREVPVIAYIEDVGASGGYMIALSGDDVFADPFGIVGSIGVISAGFGFQDAIGKLGIERRVHTAGDNKSQLDPFKPEVPADVRRLEDLLTKSHALFVDMVKARRGERLTADDGIFDGRFWIAGDAEALGLVDGTGDLRSILEDRFGKDVRVKRYDAESRNLISRLLSGSSGESLPDAALSSAEARGLWSRFGL